MRPILITVIILFMHLFATAQSWRVYYDSTELYWGSDWKKCIQLLEKSLPIVETELGKNNQNYVVLLNDLGLCYNYIGNLQQAESLYKETIALKKDILGENDLDYAATLLNLAIVYQEQNKTKEAEEVYARVLQNYAINYGENHAEYANIQNSMGQLFLTAGNFSRAEPFFKKALHIYALSYGKESSYYATALKNLGNLHRSIGDFKTARKHLSEAAAIHKGLYGENHPAFAQSIGEMAALLQQMGDYGEAEKLYIRALGIQKELKGLEELKYANTAINLAGLYIKIGLYSKAKEYFENALPIIRSLSGDNHINYATALNNYANYFIAVQDLTKAIIYFNEAINIYSNAVGEADPLFANAIINVASIYRKTGKYAEAEKLYLQAIEIDKNALRENQPSYAISLNNLGLLYMIMGEMDKALELYKNALEIKKQTLGIQHPTYAASLNNLAILHLLKEDYTEANPLFLEAIRLQLEQVKAYFPYLSEKEKDAYYNTMRADVERFNSIALARASSSPDLLGAMYNHQLATKALLFKATDKMRENILKSGDAHQISYYGMWRKDKALLGSYYQMPKPELEKQGIDVRELEEKVNTLEKELSAKSATFATINASESATWKDIQKNLKPGEAAVEMVRFRKFDIKSNFSSTNDSISDLKSLHYGFTDQIYYVALIITPDTKDYPEVVYLENGEDLELKYISYYKNAIKYQVEDFISYPIFWEDIQVKLPGIQKVYFSPDGVYSKVNLSMLFNPHSGKFLMDEQEIHLVTSTQDILKEKRAENPFKDMVMLGDPIYNLDGGDSMMLASNEDRSTNKAEEKIALISRLPGTRREVEAIKKTMETNGFDVNLKTGIEATEDVIKGIKSPKILHIATHGFFSNDLFLHKDSPSKDNPLFLSGLLLAGSENYFADQGVRTGQNSEDGVLTAFEAMNLSLENTDLVVLSACETGVGDIKNGEGVYGLQRAFQVAGAKSVILSLWKVNDVATKELMTIFYDEWVKTQDKRKAFISAQQQMRTLYPHPYYWGAFVMVGE